VAFVVVSTVAIDVIYLTRARWAIPYKYLLPGTLFLVAFQLYPILYTAYISTTNLGTGNILDKDAAIEQVVSTSVGATESDLSYAARAASSDDGTLGLILVDETTDPPSVLVGTEEGTVEIDPEDVVYDGDRVESAGGFAALDLGQAAAFERELAALEIPTDEGVIVLKTFSRAAVVGFRLQYDEVTDTMTDVETGVVYRPVDGFYRADDGTRLTPGPKSDTICSFNRV